MKNGPVFVMGSLALLFALTARCEIKVLTARNQGEDATASFRFKNLPSLAKMDAGSRATFTIVEGERDPNGGELDRLHDGKAPTEEDQPAENFFFNAGSEGGKLAVDLGNPLDVKQVNTYSWHSGTRGPQVYRLYGNDGKRQGFDPYPKKATSLETSGWKLLAKVDTRPKESRAGGQYGVSISDSEGIIGSFRFLLFDISRTEDRDTFGNTFFSEIDIVGKDDPTEAPATVAIPPFVTNSVDGYCEISIDTSAAPDLKKWAEEKLAPALAEWYPKIVAMLPSDGFTAPKKFSVSIAPRKGVAATGGTRITANASWMKKELNGEALGAIIHEEVHVIQQYGGGRRNSPDGKRAPGWLTEAIPDYIRWFKFEPQSHGADLVWLRSHKVTLRCDSPYRVGANFLNWASEKYDKDMVRKLNAAARDRKYDEEIWKTSSGHTLQELGEEWKNSVQEQLRAPSSSSRQ